MLWNFSLVKYNPTCWILRVLRNVLYSGGRGEWRVWKEFAPQLQVDSQRVVMSNEISLMNRSQKLNAYHKRCWGDVREEVNRHASTDEYSCGQVGKTLAAAPAGRVGSSIEPNHHSSLFKVRKTLLQVRTETLTGEVYSIWTIGKTVIKMTGSDLLTYKINQNQSFQQ